MTNLLPMLKVVASHMVFGKLGLRPCFSLAKSSVSFYSVYIAQTTEEQPALPNSNAQASQPPSGEGKWEGGEDKSGSGSSKKPGYDTEPEVSGDEVPAKDGDVPIKVPPVVVVEPTKHKWAQYVTGVFLCLHHPCL